MVRPSPASQMRRVKKKAEFVSAGRFEGTTENHEAFVAHRVKARAAKPKQV